VPLKAHHGLCGTACDAGTFIAAGGTGLNEGTDSTAGVNVVQVIAPADGTGCGDTSRWQTLGLLAAVFAGLDEVTGNGRTVAAAEQGVPVLADAGGANGVRVTGKATVVVTAVCA